MRRSTRRRGGAGESIRHQTERISVSLWPCLLNSLLWLKFKDMFYLAIEQQHPRVPYFCVCACVCAWSSGVLVRVMWKQQRLKLNSRKYISGDLVLFQSCIRTITVSVFGFIVRGGGIWSGWGGGLAKEQQ